VLSANSGAVRSATVIGLWRACSRAVTKPVQASSSQRLFVTGGAGPGAEAHAVGARDVRTRTTARDADRREEIARR
jgi:hypothetical protein